MRLRHSAVLGLVLAASNCMADGPAALLLRALGPVPLSYVRPQQLKYETYQGPVVKKEDDAKKNAMVQNFVYDPMKFDDLAARYELAQRNLDLGKSLLLQNSFDTVTYENAMDRVMQEYLRRIYQGYSASLHKPNKDRSRSEARSLPEMGRNFIMSYQGFRLTRDLEARVNFDSMANATRFKLYSRFIEASFEFASLDQRTRAANAENIVTIDQAMDQFTTFDRATLTVARTFADIGLRLKAKMGLNGRVLDYGFSKSLPGSLAIQVIREEHYKKDLPNFFAVQLTFRHQI